MKGVRSEFPLLSRTVDGEPLTYLDSAATSLRPRTVLEAEARYATELGANIHRGKHLLSELSSDAFENARRRVARFLGADPKEIVFVPGTTGAMNLVALGWPLPTGSNVVTSRQEHHAVLLPFMGRTELRMAPVDADGLIDPNRIESLIDKDTALVAVGWVSNVTGAIQPIEAIIQAAHAKGVPVLVDAAQAVPHLKVDVESLGADLLAFSAHKVLGPTGIGVLWGKREALDKIGAPLRGGGAVRRVGLDSYDLRDVPERLEPGTPHISGALGLAAALDFIADLDRTELDAHERRLTERLLHRLQDVKGAQLLGPRDVTRRVSLASLVLRPPAPAPDHVAMVLSDRHRIMVRSGHMCAHPFFDSLELPGALRASAYLYNTEDEIDRFADALVEILGAFIK